jgi:hypothetical protein
MRTDAPGESPRVARVFLLVVTLLSFGFFAAAVSASDIGTSIDTTYSYSRSDEGDDLTQTKSLTEKVDVTYTTSLGNYYDFSGRVGGEYVLSRKTESPDSTTVTGSMDLKLSGDAAAFSASYSGTKGHSDAGFDSRAIDSYSNNLVLETSGKLPRLPQYKIKWEHKRDFQLQAVERIGDQLDVELKYALEDFGADFKYTQATTDNLIPDGLLNEEKQWEANLVYGRKFSDLLDLQMDYNIKEALSEDYAVGVFSFRDKQYDQKFKVSFKSALEPLPGLSMNLGYDLQLEQDLLAEEFDQKLEQKVSAGIRRDLLRWATLGLNFESTNNTTYNIEPDEDEEKVKTKVGGTIRVRPLRWLDFDTKAETETITSREQKTGDDIEEKRMRKLENNLSAVSGEDLKLNFSQAYEDKYTNGVLESKSTKYRFRGTWKPIPHILIDQGYEIGLDKAYGVETGTSEFLSLTRTRDAQFAIAFDKAFKEVLMVHADHSYGYKVTEEEDRVHTIVEKAELSEQTKFRVQVVDIIKGMIAEVEYARAATDTRDDEEPMIVNRTLTAKLTWEYKEKLNFSSEYKFDNLGDADDSLTFSTKITWKEEFLEVSGEYQYEKKFSEEVSETRKYDLKCRFIF